MLSVSNVDRWTVILEIHHSLPIVSTPGTNGHDPSPWATSQAGPDHNIPPSRMTFARETVEILLTGPSEAGETTLLNSLKY